MALQSKPWVPTYSFPDFASFKLGAKMEPVSLKEEPKYLFDIPYNEIKTQKARGVALSMHTTLIPGVVGAMVNENDNVIPRLYPQNSIEKYIPWETGMFVRPCPVKPRHGFVDSRVVYSEREALAVYTEALKEDADAELLVMQPYTGKYSAVATSAGVTWGFDNDGVTSGKGSNVTIPSYGGNPSMFLTHLRLHLLGIGETYEYYHDNGVYETEILQRDIPDSAYLELVEHNGSMRLAQVRNGPAQPTTDNYIPDKVIVTKIITPCYKNKSMMTLLEWEKYVQENAVFGTVIFLHGMALSSHYAVHGIEHRIPVLTSMVPVIGQMLQPMDSVSSRALTQKDIYDLHVMMQSLAYRTFIPAHGSGSSYTPGAIDQAVAGTTVATVHAQSLWDNSPHLLKLRAISMLQLPRMLYAACYGELRHWDGKVKLIHSATNQPDPITPMLASGDNDITRAYIYRETLNETSLSFMKERLTTMVADFSSEGWEFSRWDPEGFPIFGNTPIYGGKKWANCAKATVNYITALEYFLKKPTLYTWKEVILVANIAIHEAHNNGGMLSKWISKPAMNAIAACPAYGFMNMFAGRIVLGEKVEQ